MPPLNMTDAKYELADLLLLNFPIQTAVGTLAFMNSILASTRNYTPEMANNIQQLIIKGERDARLFLLQQGYLETVDHKIPQDKLTTKGEKAQLLGGHKQYIEWEEREKRKQAVEDFPKKKWWLYKPLELSAGFILTTILGFFLGYFKGSHDATKKEQVKIQSPVQQSPQKDTAQRLPKTAGKKDSAK